MMRLRQDLTYAIRTFAKAPSFTAIAVVVLAVGIGANTAVFSVVNELLWRPHSAAAGEVVGVYSRDRTRPDSYRLFSYPAYTDVRDSGTFESVLAQTYTMVGTPSGDGTRRMLAAVISSNYFETLRVRLAAGRVFGPDEERPGARIPVAIATYSAWERAGLSPAFLGSTVTINNVEFTIVGIAPEGFSGTLVLLSPEIFVPLGMFDTVVDNPFKNNGRGLGDRANVGLSVSGRLAPGLSIAAATERLDGLARRLEAAHAEHRNVAFSADILPRLALSPGPQSGTALGMFAGFLLTLSGLVLVVACLNIANMLLARGTMRRKEIAVRLAMGAKRSRIVAQLLTESLLLASAGGVLGLLFSYWAMRVFVGSLNASLPFSLTLRPTPDLPVLAATLAFTAIGTVAFGLGPALGLSRRDLVSDLKDRGQAPAAGRRRLSAKNALVVVQIALSLGLLTAGGVFARTTAAAAAGRPGYEYAGLVLARIDTKLAGLDASSGAATYRELLSRARALPGVSAATVTSSVPFGESQGGALLERVAAGQHEPVRARAFRTIGADYFSVLGLRMLRGREFTLDEETSAAGARVAIVDEAFGRRLFGDTDPVGQLIRAPASESGEPAGEPLEIVGIAPPIRAEMLDREPAPHVYVPFGRNYRSDMFLQLRAAPGVNERATLDRLRSVIREVDGRVPLLASSTMQAHHDTSAELLALSAAAGTFAGLGLVALVIASIGVYGIRAYLVAQRTREIGIRMALGASPGEVLRLVLRDGAALTLAGLALGLPLALLASVALRAVFVDVGGIDLAVLAVTSVVLVLAVTFAGAVPARRATRVEPLTALRTE